MLTNDNQLKLARKTQVWISYSTVKFIAQHILQCHCRRKPLPSCPRVSSELGLIGRRTRSASSRITLLSARLDSATPSLLHFHSAIVRAGLCTDEHLRQLFRMTPKSRDKFILQALGKSTLFERVAVMDILGRMNNEL